LRRQCRQSRLLAERTEWPHWSQTLPHKHLSAAGRERGQ
jgi:hypothetical protein